METVVLSPQRREQLQDKMREVFQEEMRELSGELQGILADDIVTAFLNRITVFLQIKSKTNAYTSTKRSPNP